MSFLTKLFAGGGGQLVEGITGLVDKFKASPDDKMAFKLELEKLVAARDAQLSQEIMAETRAKAQVMTAELRQGDTYTKRLRPTIGYSGLVLILLVVVAQFWGKTIVIPMEFTVAWGGLVGVYSIGRTAEKRGAATRATSMITGSDLLD